MLKKQELYIFELHAFLCIFKTILNLAERDIYCKMRIHITIYTFNSLQKLITQKLKPPTTIHEINPSQMY